jgi:hypothetical protein
MAMVPFFTRFPDLAAEETRTITLQATLDGIPPGEYAFMEMFCDEPGCDCRRVHLLVISPPPSQQVWANINYGWEPAAFYEQWSRAKFRQPNPFLDPINPQSDQAPALLALFEELCLTDEGYVRRLARHYELFKTTVDRVPRSRQARRLAERKAQKRAVG